MKLDVWNEIVRLFPNRSIPWPYANARARFNAAQKFDTATFRAMPKPTELSYSSLIGVAFAYSALEAVEAIYEKSSRKQIRTPIVDSRLAELLQSRLMEDFLSGIALSITSESLKEAFASFKAGNSSNLRPVVEATRHAVFHGKTSPSRLGLRAVKRRAILELLTTQTLATANTAFSELHLDHGVPEKYLKPDSH
jgi:hypothetical protein